MRHITVQYFTVQVHSELSDKILAHNTEEPIFITYDTGKIVNKACHFLQSTDDLVMWLCNRYFNGYPQIKEETNTKITKSTGIDISHPDNPVQLLTPSSLKSPEKTVQDITDHLITFDNLIPEHLIYDCIQFNLELNIRLEPLSVADTGAIASTEWKTYSVSELYRDVHNKYQEQFNGLDYLFDVYKLYLGKLSLQHNNTSAQKLFAHIALCPYIYSAADPNSLVAFISKLKDAQLLDGLKIFTNQSITFANYADRLISAIRSQQVPAISAPTSTGFRSYLKGVYNHLKVRHDVASLGCC